MTSVSRGVLLRISPVHFISHTHARSHARAHAHRHTHTGSSCYSFPVQLISYTRIHTHNTHPCTHTPSHDSHEHCQLDCGHPRYIIHLKQTRPPPPPHTHAHAHAHAHTRIYSLLIYHIHTPARACRASRARSPARAARQRPAGASLAPAAGPIVHV